MTARTRTATRRIAQAGFAFFLVKGLLWLAIPGVVYLLR